MSGAEVLKRSEEISCSKSWRITTSSIFTQKVLKNIYITKTKLTLIPVNAEWSVSYKLEVKLSTDSLMKNPEDEEPLPADEETKDPLEWG